MPRAAGNPLPLARAHGALTAVDGHYGHRPWPHDVQALGCDFSAYFPVTSCMARMALGVLYGCNEALHHLRHWQFGGEMVQQADYHSASFALPRWVSRLVPRRLPA